MLAAGDPARALDLPADGRYINMKAIIYAARSKDEEPGKDSTGDQVKAIRRALSKDREVVGKPHIDHASGSKSNRGPGLEAAIEAAVTAAPSELWVWHTNRLGRGTSRPKEARAVGALLYQLREKGVDVRSVEDDEFATNEMLWSFASAQASKYATDLSAALRRGRRSVFEKGQWGGGPVPDGYKLGPPVEHGPRGIVIDEARAAIIRRAFELAEEGLAMGAIARRLNEEGHHTRPQRPGKKRPGHSGLPWTGETVKDVLSNPVYAGRVCLNRDTPEKEVRDGLHEALIEPDVFDRLGVKNVLRAERGGGRPSASTLLSGLARCDRCNGPLWGRIDPYVRKDGTRRRSYRCRNAKAGTCDLPRLDAQLIDPAIRKHLAEQFVDFNKWAQELATTQGRERALIEKRLAAARRRLIESTRKRDVAMARYLDDQDDPLREEALRVARELVEGADAAVQREEKALAAVPAEPPKDAMLDVYNELRRKLDLDPAPLNERLKNVFAEFRVDVLEGPTGDHEIIVAPVLSPDVVEAHTRAVDTIRVVDGDEAWDETETGRPGSAREPLLLLISPPTTGLSIPVNSVDNAWA